MNNNYTNQTNGDDPPKTSPEILNLFSKATMLELTSSEKEKGYNALKSFMENAKTTKIQTGDKDDKKDENGKKSVLSPYLKKLSPYVPSFVKSRQLVYTLVLACFIFSLVAGCAQAAQNSLPGDFLYPIKIQVNERIERALASNTETRARVALKQAVTRLEETEKLIATKKMDVFNKVSIDKDVVYASSYVTDSIAKLKAEGQADLAIQISSDFEDSMISHEKNIADVLKDVPESSRKSLEAVREHIKSGIVLSATLRADLEGGLTHTSKIREAKESALIELDNSEKKIQYVEKYVQVNGAATATSVEENKDMQQSIEYMKRTVAKGKEKLTVGAYTDALTLFKDASKKAEYIDEQIRNLRGLKKNERSFEIDGRSGSTTSISTPNAA
jgi:hypothetical protein